MTWFSRLVAAYRYRGRHRGVYDPAIGKEPVDPSQPIYLGSVLWDAKWYGMVSDSESPGMMTATFEVAPEGGLCSIPLPDLPFTWEPHVYSHGPGGFSVRVMPVVPTHGNLKFDPPQDDSGAHQPDGTLVGSFTDWYGPMDFGVPPGLPQYRPELGPYSYQEHFDENR